MVTEIFFSRLHESRAVPAVPAIAGFHEVGVEDGVRAAEPLPPFGVRLAYPDDEVPAVPHDRFGLFLVEHR